MKVQIARFLFALLFGLIIAQSWVFSQSKNDRFSLAEKYPPDSLRNILPNHGEWLPYPKIADRDSWMEVPEAVRVAHIQEGEKYLGASWAPLPATVFLEFERIGNRSNYQALSYERRDQLVALVWAEVYENQGRFLDDIVNGIWAISEETYWGIPAHLDIQTAGYGLPDVNEPTVDLFAAETANLMAWTDYLLGDRLDVVSPLVRQRIHSELHRRILKPNLERDDFWWMNFRPNTVINNWNPWVNSNWLLTVLLAETDFEKRVAAVHKILRSIDVFIDYYPSDGGCDEGPGYWSRAGGSLYDVLEMLFRATDGKLDGFDQKVVHEMGRYVYRAYIGGGYYVNFADAAPTANLDPALVFGYGQRIQDETMQQFGKYLADEQKLGEGLIPGSFGSLARQLHTLSRLQEMANIPPAEPLVRDAWLPDIQVVAARSEGGSTDGLYIAAKGGHNAESHNHNDIGNFIVYRDAKPVLIDVGVGVYTKQTFSDDRYSIWTMQSAYHNVPTINGVMQKDGRQFAARNVSHSEDDAGVQYSLDLAGAYPVEAAVDTYQRTIDFYRGKEIRLRDSYRLSESREPVQLHFMTVARPEIQAQGMIELEQDNTVTRMHYDADLLRADVESITLDDPKMTANWGRVVYRITLSTRDVDKSGTIEVRIN